MKRRRPPGIWVTNHRANPVLRPLLHGPAGRRLGRRLALIRYRGRRTGRVYELPVQYARDGDRVWILPGAPGYKTWWRNLRGGAGAELVVAGHDRHGHATVIGRSQPPEFAESLTAYLRANPRARRTPSCPGTLHQHPPTAGCGRSAMARCWSVSTLMIEPRDLTPPGVLSNAPILTVAPAAGHEPVNERATSAPLCAMTPLVGTSASGNRPAPGRRLVYVGTREGVT